MFKVKPNIGLLNSFVRLICGFTMLGWGTAKLVKRPYSNIPFFVVMMGAMKIAEGITRFCPVTYIAQEKIEQLTHNEHANDQADEEPINPS